MGRIKLIKDGNLSRWFRFFLIIFGIGAMYCAVKIMKPSVWSGLVLLAGLGIAAVGGYASQAHMLKIKPFDNGHKKARGSYKADDSDEDKKP